jgi:uncharacterized membrane protein YdjX (TVP38/TMEM64 family)
MEVAPKATSGKMYWRFIGITFFIFLLIFALAEAMGLHFMDSTEQMRTWTLPVAALVGVALLAADIFLPVPSSVIMVANGSLFGLVGGSLLSIVGGLGAALIGYWMGQKGKGLLKRWFRPQDFEVGDRFFARWGISSVIVSRPVPLIAETISVAAGAGNLGWKKMLWGSLLGTVPTAVAYAWAGAYLESYNAGIYAFLAVVGFAGIFVTLGYLLQRNKR